MSYQELKQRNKVRSDVEDLNAKEREVYGAFIALGETESDRRILANAWLRQHRLTKMNRAVRV